MIALFLIGCGGGEATVEKHDAPEPAPVEEPKALSDVEKALAVSKAIDADESKADDALKEAGLTEDEYRALLYKIAKDPGMAEEFASKR